MSKAVNIDHEFNIEKYSKLLSQAQGGRTQTKFAKDCGLSVAYICKHLNKRINKPPIPSTLKKIAAVAANGITYEDLLDAAGYDVDKYGNTDINTLSDSSSTIQELDFNKLATATITTALSNSNVKWFVNGNSISNNTYYDMDIELQDCQITHWFFKFITIPSGSLSTNKEAFMECIYSHFGQLTLYADIHTKYSFVTASSELYNLVKSNPPTALATHISVILIDISTLSIRKEEYIKTALSDNNIHIVSLK